MGSTNGPAGAPVFDCESQVLEPAALWDEYLDPAYRVAARSGFWHGDHGAGAFTVLNGRLAPELPGRGIPRHAIWRPGMKPDEIGGLDPGQRHPASPGACDAGARLRDMDAMGVHQALVLPTLFNEYFPFLESPDLARALAEAYNDWALAFCAADPRRLYPVAVLPTQEPGMALAELERAAARGFRAALVAPVFQGDRYPTQGSFRPLWRALEISGMAACVRPPLGVAAPELQANAPFVERVAATLEPGHPVSAHVGPVLDNANFLISLMAEGLMEKYPGLKLLALRSGVAWLSIALEKAETYLWLSDQEEPVSLDPQGVYFRRENLVSFSAGEGAVRRMWPQLRGVAAWGSRYPAHDTATAREAAEDLERGGVPADEIARLLGGNARRVLGIAAPDEHAGT